MEISSEQEKGTQPITAKKGGLRTMPFIIANESLEKVAGVGLQANMILYLKKEYHLDNAKGLAILLLWNALSNFMAIAGAFLADSCFGRFRVLAFAIVFYLSGISVLWSTAIFPQARPPHCNPLKEKCVTAEISQLMLLFVAFILMSIGSGGIKPCTLAFAADQLDKPDNIKNGRVMQTFFNWYYVSVGISVMLSVTVIIYIQDKYGWFVGFGVPVALMLLATIMFFLGSFLYIKVKADKTLFMGLAHVASAAWKNKHLSLPPRDSHSWFYHKGSKLLIPTDKLRFLNKACVIKSPEDLTPEGLAVEPWSLCTVKQVEELKALIRVLPIWSTAIMIGVTISQQQVPVLQANTMDRHLISNFSIPPGSFIVFGILTLTTWVAIYDRLVVPTVSKYTKNPRGLSFKQRMGTGLALSCLATTVAALVERNRRKTAISEGLSNNPFGVVNMSAMWLVPQYCLTGLAEAFNLIGQIEFYYSQFPKSMTSIGMALFALGMGLGSLTGSLIIGIVNAVTEKGGQVSWVTDNLNMGHYDYYYWLLTVLSVVNFFYYLICSWAYGSCDNVQIWDEVDGIKEEDVTKSIGSPLIFSP